MDHRLGGPVVALHSQPIAAQQEHQLRKAPKESGLMCAPRALLVGKQHERRRGGTPGGYARVPSPAAGSLATGRPKPSTSGRKSVSTVVLRLGEWVDAGEQQHRQTEGHGKHVHRIGRGLRAHPCHHVVVSSRNPRPETRYDREESEDTGQDRPAYIHTMHTNTKRLHLCTCMTAVSTARDHGLT